VSNKKEERNMSEQALFYTLAFFFCFFAKKEIFFCKNPMKF